MKNLILIIFILFLSCTAKKTIVKTDTQQNITQQNAITDTQSDQTKSAATITGQVSDSTHKVTKIIKYDTTKPEPVVSEETTITEDRIGNKVISSKTEIARDTKSEVVDNSKIEVETKEQVKTVEIPKKPAVMYYFYILAILVVLGAVYWIRKKTTLFK
jgi:cobalamin biosynthesis Mg chelatase CobN